MNLTETIAWARSVPRSARVAQGYPRIRDFAHHVMRVRDERARRRKMPALSHEQQGIVEGLQAALDADPILRRMARTEADMRPHDPIPCSRRRRPVQALARTPRRARLRFRQIPLAKRTCEGDRVSPIIEACQRAGGVAARQAARND